MISQASPVGGPCRAALGPGGAEGIKKPQAPSGLRIGDRWLVIPDPWRRPSPRRQRTPQTGRSPGSGSSFPALPIPSGTVGSGSLADTVARPPGILTRFPILPLCSGGTRLNYALVPCIIADQRRVTQAKSGESLEGCIVSDFQRNALSVEEFTTIPRKAGGRGRREMDPWVRCGTCP